VHILRPFSFANTRLPHHDTPSVVCCVVLLLLRVCVCDLFLFYHTPLTGYIATDDRAHSPLLLFRERMPSSPHTHTLGRVLCGVVLVLCLYV